MYFKRYGKISLQPPLFTGKRSVHSIILIEGSSLKLCFLQLILNLKMAFCGCDIMLSGDELALL